MPALQLIPENYAQICPESFKIICTKNIEKLEKPK